MLFCTLEYLVFFLVVFTVYWAIPKAHWRIYLLLGASFFFYASWNKWLAGIIFFSSFLDYCLALGMDRFQSKPWRKLLVVVSVVANLGLLAYFKYANFFLRSVEDALFVVGLPSSLPVLKVILPIGISFYTFESISYTVDVYRRRIPAERNLAHFILFITFFPHLIAGPIVRARDFLPQIRRPKHWDWLRLQLGMELFLIGLFKKMVIADRMAMFADPVFAQPAQFATYAVWLAVLAYAIQIYCDFSGYTDMALGTAHMFGYKLAQNFNMPYLACNIAEFWHRWHISLSTWLRDYLFIPLGGSRGDQGQTCLNLMITMILGGLWHGAAWPFVIWGTLHGSFLIVHRGFQRFCKSLPLLNRLLQTPLVTGLRMGITFFCVCIGWVFFRSTTQGPNGAVEGPLKMLQGMFKLQEGLGCPLPVDSLVTLTIVMILGHIIGQTKLSQWFAYRLPAPVWGMAYGVLVTLALVLAPETGAVFIYFQF